MRSVKLGDLLPENIIQALMPIMSELKTGTLSLDVGKRRLSDLLAPEEHRLLEQGVVKDYLVYMLLGMALESAPSRGMN